MCSKHRESEERMPNAQNELNNLTPRLQVAMGADQSETAVEFTAIIRATTGQAGYCAFDWTHAREFALAIWTLIQVAPRAFTDGKGEIVTALFVGNTEVAACKTPLVSVSENSAATGPVLSENMSEFVSQSAIDLRRMLKQP